MNGIEEHGLDHYALKSMDYGRLTGVAIACHAIEDCFLLMHVGVGCKNKATAHLLVHDWKEHGNIREGWTEVADSDLILGASMRAGPYIRSWYKRLEPGLMIMVTVTFLSLAGEDLSDQVERASADVPCPVLLVSAPGYEGDMYAGYASVVLAVAQQIPWKDGPSEPKRVSLIGYCFDRYEGDHQGNLQQIRGMLKSLGLELGPGLLTGNRYAEALDVGRSGLLVELPYTLPIRKKLRRVLKGRETVQTDLPMGIAGTSRWMRAVGAAAGVDPRKVDLLVERREAAVREQLEGVVDRLRSRRVAILAETPLAAGLCATALELGLDPVLVGLRGTSLGGAEALRATLAADGHSLPEGAVVLEDPSLATLRDRLVEALHEGLEGFFGSATDLNVLTTISPRELVRDHAGGRLAPSGPFLVEVGFPSKDYHPLFPTPFLGYGGVVVMAQRILDARRLWDAGRAVTFQI